MDDLQLFDWLHEHYQCDAGKLKCIKQAPYRNNKVGEYAGTPRKDGYMVWFLQGKLKLLHHVIWFMHHKVWPTKLDHIDHNRSNNHIDNLREVTHGENLRNSSKSRNNSSGHTGIHWYKRRNKWHVQLMINRKRIHVGYYVSLDEAIAERDKAYKLYGFHPNHGK